MKLFYTLFISLFLATTSFAGAVTLEWSPNSEPDLAGYKVFMREAGNGYNYALPTWQGTETTCTIENIDDNKTYRFVARAFDTESYESGNSNEVSYISGTIPDGLPPGTPARLTIIISIPAP